MVSPISAPAGPTSASVAQVSRHDFLKLLVTQLRHQDPLNPMDGTEFATQLAQFSSLEQLVGLNDHMDAQSRAGATSTLAIQTGVAAGLLGARVTATGDQAVVPNSGAASFTVDVAAPGAAVTIHLLDEHGREVGAQTFNGLPKGRQTLSWDVGQSVSPGLYRFTATGETANGDAVPVTTLVTGIVDGFVVDQGSVLLRSGQILIPIGQLRDVVRG